MPRRRVVTVLDGDLGGAGLAVPQQEIAEIDATPLLHRGDEILDRRGMIVVMPDIDVHAAAEPSRAEQGVDHADDFGALVVDRRGVEIVDAQIALRLHRVGERAGILGELRGAQCADIADTRHRRAALVGRKELVAKHGQPFLQRQLKPVAARDSIAGPVVEIFVGDHRLDALVVAVGRGVGLRQHVARVEDVEAFVLHRPHVEVADRDDVEDIEVVFETKGLLVPVHRLFSEAIAWPHLSSSPRRTQIANGTTRPERVVNSSRKATRSPATSANR